MMINIDNDIDDDGTFKIIRSKIIVQISSIEQCEWNENNRCYKSELKRKRDRDNRNEIYVPIITPIDLYDLPEKRRRCFIFSFKMCQIRIWSGWMDSDFADDDCDGLLSTFFSQPIVPIVLRFQLNLFKMRSW